MAELDRMFSPRPAERLRAARGASRRQRSRLGDIEGWPDLSPGARNAWLLFVTTKPPTWSDPLVPWPTGPLTLGEPHDGFLYPDPIGFWAEVRRWSLELLRSIEPVWSVGECLALTALVHTGEDAGRWRRAVDLCRPRTTVFLDEAAWISAGLDVPVERLAVPDPHREGQVYEGWWGTAADGSVVGKSPQHPTMHRLYRSEDLARWLRLAPRPTGA